MSFFNIFDVSGSALNAQTVRLNTMASNMANAETASATAEGAYRARHPVFATVMANTGGPPDPANARVRVVGVVESQAEARVEYRPHHPLADENGYVFMSNVNPMEEMADMISASRSYQTNVEVINTSKQLMLRTLELGK